MHAEVLIAGAPARDDLMRAIAALGYRAQRCAPHELVSYVRRLGVPSAIVVCVRDTETTKLMASLRRNRRGASVPVILYGKLGDEIRDLADVLDLGADHFLEAPYDGEELEQALLELAGPPEAAGVAAAPAEPLTDHGSREHTGSWPAPEEKPTSPPPRPVARTSEGTERLPRLGSAAPAADPALGHLQQTLDRLEARLRVRDGGPDRDPDDDELQAMGLDPVHPGDPEDVFDPADSQDSMVLRGAVHTPPSRQSAPRGERTVRLSEDSGSFGEVSEPRLAQRVPRARQPVQLPFGDHGTLEDIESPRLIWRLCQLRFSGLLTLALDRAEKKIWFDDGRIVFAASNVAGDRFVDHVLSMGLISRSQFETARRLAAKEPRRAGQLLVESGFLKATELQAALRAHLTRIVDSTFAWFTGSWTIDADESVREPIRIEQTPAALIVQGIANRLDTEALWARVGDDDRFPRLRPGVRVMPAGLDGFASELELPASARALLKRLDGRQALRELMHGGTHDPAQVLALVHGLSVIGALDLLDEAEPAAPRAHDAAEIDRRRVLERLALARESDYFSLLGLDAEATRIEVRRAAADARETIADDRLESATREALKGELVELREALEEAEAVLADDALRSAYLAHLEEL